MQETANERKFGVYAMFAVVVLSCALGSLTQTSTNSMLLNIATEFGVDESVGQWLTTLYMLVVGITVPLVTHISARLGAKWLMLLSLGLFLLGAVVDFFAPNFWVLLVGRVPQAVATGITLPLVQFVAMTRFPRGQTGTAMGIAGIAMGFAPNIGPLVGGALVDTLGWRSFFGILCVVIAALIVCAFAVMHGERAGAAAQKLDGASFALSTLGFGGLLVAFTDAANMPLASAAVCAPAVLGVACLAAFIVRQRRIENPLISMEIFKSPSYVASFIAQNCLFASFMGITLILPLFVQNEFYGGSAFDAGPVFVPATVAAIIFNPLAGILSDRIGVRPVAICGGTLLFVGAASMVFINAETPLWRLMVMQGVRGVGVSTLMGPLNSWGMHELPHRIMMDGSAFFAAVRQACASFGTALMMLVLSSRAIETPDELAFSFGGALALSAAFALAVLVVIIWKVRDN